MGRRVKTRQELVRIEFGESRDHFRQAAHHAAEGLGASVGPRYSAAKVRANTAKTMVGPSAQKVGTAAQQGWTSTIAVLTPLADAAREGSVRAASLPSEKDMAKPKKAKNVNGTEEGGSSAGLIGLLAAGAALGAAGALVARRRNRARWAEYEPSELETDASAMSGMDAGQQGAASKLAHWARENTRTAVGTVRSRMPRSGNRTLDEMNERVADAGTGVTTQDLTGESVARPGEASTKRPGEAPGDRPGRAPGDRPGRAPGERPEGAAGAAGGSMADEVDELLRSSEDGKI
jgi:hypothetical protein